MDRFRNFRCSTLGKLYAGIALMLLSSIGLSADKHELTFDILESYPFAYIDSDGKKVGTYWEYVDAIGKVSGLKMNRRIVPKPRVVVNLKSGVTDAAILFKTNRLAPYVSYVAKVRSVPIVVATTKGRLIDSYEDLRELYAVGVFRSGSISPQFDNDILINKVSVSNYTSMVKMIGRGRVDAIVGNGLIIEALIQKLCLQDKIEISPLELANKEQWLVMSNKSKLLSQVNTMQVAVDSLKRDGLLDQIFDRHLSESAMNCHGSVDKL